MHHNPCFNLFILHSNPFDNQGREINKNNNIFLRFDILSFTKTFFLLYIYMYMYLYYLYITYICIHTYRYLYIDREILSLMFQISAI